MVINWEILRSHYLQANREAQVNSLALNLARIYLLAHSETDGLMAQHLVRESQFFIEWIVPEINLETDIEFATELVDLQRVLSYWKLSWFTLWANEYDRRKIATLAQEWCDRLQNRCLIEM
jgi:hypothetical protein